MKKNLLLLITGIMLTAIQFAGAQNCVPGTQTIPGIYPDSATGLKCAIVSSLYSEVITAVVPIDTTTDFGGNPTAFWIDSIVLLSITGLPTGIVYGCAPSSCGFPGGTSGCVKVTGTPTVVGLYPLNVYTRAYVRDKLFNISATQDDTISYYFINVVNSLVLDTTSVTNTTCGVGSGAIDLAVTGGTGSYTYSWNTTPTQTTQDITGLTAGIYTVTVTDGCFPKTLSVTVADPGLVSVDTVSVTHVSVFGGNNGAINITVTGGTPPYAFSWTGPGGPYSTEDLDTLSAGTYAVTVTDSNNCSSALSINIGQPVGISEINAQSFSIVQNRPNPFTDKTEIIFTAAESGVVKFKVYNVLGKLVYGENINAKRGINTVSFFANDLPAGIYLYDLSNAQQRVVRKMIIKD